MLPWHVGESWQMITSQKQGVAASSFQSVTFAGGDGQVLAASQGRLYRLCDANPDQSLIEIIASDGTATEYYQMANETTVPDGGLVQAGTYLGMTGTATSCGGTIQEVDGAYSPEVEFAVLRAGSGAAASMTGLPIGGWTFREGSAPPGEWAQRGGTTVVSGGLLQNFGLPAAAPATSPAKLPHPSPRPVPTPDPSPDPTASLSAAIFPASLRDLWGVLGGSSPETDSETYVNL
jgi:LasA protease